MRKHLSLPHPALPRLCPLCEWMLTMGLAVVAGVTLSIFLQIQQVLAASPHLLHYYLGMMELPVASLAVLVAMVLGIDLLIKKMQV